ncbi:serine/threonine-protein kinase [Phenylobacterium sp.]|uniref:serine/threonine-protein kinase n=1 Tax=Phenylobacterium sp. TaxID=1871053 RepID=UPI0025F4D32D|nr:serine/threonine-protein kinase [Phenylobacterium sp.]
MIWKTLWSPRSKIPPSRLGRGAETHNAPAPRVELHRRAIEAFYRLSEAGEVERRAWLQATALADPALATEVAAMLIADGQRSGDLPTAPGLPANDEDEAFPLHVGPYRLVRRLGGGMGDVFLAERNDGLFEHTVAIKLIRSGRSMQRLSAHLLEERRILASLQHPNIAQLFGGGATPDGLPFIVMEYLAGVPITEYADANNLPLPKLLRMFQTVCEAVQFAHQTLVVHADIKPSNIMVTVTGQVKLLDFGIAQWSDRRQSGRTPLEGGPPMTQAYAAPERLAGGEPTVAADVYALGVLLHELLTGRLPKPADAALKTRGPTVLPSAILESDPSAFRVRARDLRGELDAVVEKAMAGDPAHRYASVLELSQDLDRYAQGLPVRAIPDSWPYRARRFLGRHRLGLSLTAGALVTASSIAVATSLLYLQSEHNRALADLRFGETRRMADHIISDVDLQLADVPGTLALRRRLVAESRSYLETLEKDHEASPELRLDIAKGYLRLARIYGLDVTGGLGDLPAARQSLSHARSLLQSIGAVEPANPQLTALRAEAALDAGTEIFVAPDSATLDHALGELESAQALYGSYLRERPSDIDAQLGLWRAQVMTARAYAYRQDMAKALAVVTSNLGKASLPVRTREQAKNRDFILNGSYLMLAEGYADTAPSTAYGYYQKLNANLEAIRRRGDRTAQEAFLQSTALAGMAETSEAMGNLRRAAPLYSASISGMRQLLGFGPNSEVSRNLLYVESRLAGLYSKMDRVADALRMSQAVVAGASEQARGRLATPANRRMRAVALQERGLIEHRAGDVRAACATEREALAEWTVTRPASVALAIDLAPDGPLAHLRGRILADCAR